MVTRHERVVLSLEDKFSREIGQAAVAAKTFERTLKDLDGTNARVGVSSRKAAGDVDVFTKSTRPASDSINQLTGRLRLFADIAATLGPALVPIGAAVVPVLAGLAAQLGAAAGAAGVAVLAFQGVGDALGAVNDYQLEPTQANLEKLTEEFAKIGPAGADFVLFLDSIGPQLKEIQNIARAGLLPGVQDGIESLLTMGPQVNSIVQEIAGALGEMSANAGDALSGDRFAAFFDYIENTAGPALMEMGRTIGYVTEGLANMMVAFSPAASDFTGGLESMTKAFAEWSRGLETNDSFQSFLDYVRESGPAVVDLLGSLIDAVSGLVQAAAPVGAIVVPALTAVADAFAGIASSPIGTPILTAAAAFVALNRATSVLSPALKFVGDRLYLTSDSLAKVGTAADPAARGMTKIQKAAAGLAVLQIAIMGLQQLEGAMRDALPTADELTTRLLDLQDGSVANLGEDFTQLGDSIGRLTDSNVLEKAGDGLLKVMTLGQLEGQRLGDARVEIELLDEALTNLVTQGGPDAAREAFSALAVAQGLTADEQKRLLTLLPGYTDGLANAANSARLNGDATGDMSDEIGGAAANLESLRGKLQAARQELKESRQAARDIAGTFVNLGDSLNDSEKSLGDWLSELERNAQALRNFQRNAREAGKKGLDEGLVKALQNAGKEGARRMAQLANATDAEIDRANEAWRKGQGAVKDFVKEVGGVKPKYVTRLEAQVEQAMADLARLRAQLNIPDEYVNIWVTTRKVNGGGMGPQIDSARGNILHFANGDIANGHQPQIARGGVTRVWAEPETKGEAYIPLANDSRRPRARAIAAETVSLLGGVAHFAQGGVVSGRADRGGWESAEAFIQRMMRYTGKLTDSLERQIKAANAELRIREKHLAKEVEAAKEQAKAQRAMLKDLRAQSKEFRDAVAANFRTQSFGSNVDLLEAARTGAVQLDMAAVESLANRNGMSDASTEEQVRAYLASLSSSQLGALEVQAQYGLAGQQTRSAKAFEALLAQLTDLGLDGALFQQLSTSGNTAQAQYLATLSPEEIEAYEQRFKANRQAARSTGSFAADAEFKSAIRDQTREMRSAVREFRESNTELKEHTKLMRQFDNRLERLEKATSETGPKKTAEGVGKVINDAAAGARR